MKEKTSFEILCATMNQKDFSLIQKMNVRSNVVFANQCEQTQYSELELNNGRYAKMISTNTVGVGINRNVALMYSSADICLFSDDDVVYFDNAENIICEEFQKNKKADIIIFHFNSDTKGRLLKKYRKTHRVGRFSKKPWATFQIAFRRSEVIKRNILFTTLFGGGCKYPCGEDTQWIRSAIQNGLRIVVSNRTIGNVSFKESTWFHGYNEEYYYGQGAAYESHSKFTKYIWFAYIYLRTKNESSLSCKEIFAWMNNGAKGYKELLSFKEFCEKKWNWQ